MVTSLLILNQKWVHPRNPFARNSSLNFGMNRSPIISRACVGQSRCYCGKLSKINVRRLRSHKGIPSWASQICSELLSFHPYPKAKCHSRASQNCFSWLGGIQVYRRCTELIQTHVSCPNQMLERLAGNLSPKKRCQRCLHHVQCQGLLHSKGFTQHISYRQKLKRFCHLPSKLSCNVVFNITRKSLYLLQGRLRG